MGNPATREQFYRLLETGLKEVSENQWNDLPSQLSQLYRSIPSNSAWEEFFNIGSVGDIPAFNGKLEYLTQAPGYLTRIESKTYAAGRIFERELIEDKKYGVMSDQVASLTRSAQRTKEKLGIEASFAYAFSTAHLFQYSEEGVALCSDAHTTKSGASTSTGFDNCGTSAFNKTSLAATKLAMRRFRDDIGERIDLNPDTIIFPSSIADTVREVVGSDKDPDTANNTINVQYGKWKLIEIPRLDDYDPNNWFVVDSREMKRHLLMIDRVPKETNTTIDFETFAAKWSIRFRVAFGWKEWRWVFGHQVS